MWVYVICLCICLYMCRYICTQKSNMCVLYVYVHVCTCVYLYMEALWTCVYAWMCVYMFMDMSVHVYMNLFMETWSRRWVSFSVNFHLIFQNRVSHWNQSSPNVQSTWPMNLRDMSVSASLSYPLELYSFTCIPLGLAFTWVLRIWTRFLMLRGKHFTVWISIGNIYPMDLKSIILHFRGDRELGLTKPRMIVLPFVSMGQLLTQSEP